MDRVACEGGVEHFLARVPDADRPLAFVTVSRLRAPSVGRLQHVMDALRSRVALVHPNLVRVLDVDRVEEHLLLATERVDGRSLDLVLSTLRARGERMPTLLAAFVVLQACRALHHVHTRTDPDGTPLGVVHGAVWPGNVVVGFDGKVKVDGLVLHVARSALDQAEPAAVAAYTAPQQAVDAVRGDVYGLGAVLYEALTGKSLERVLAELDGERDALPAAGQLNPAIPSALQAVVHQAMALDLTARLPTARALGEELRWAALAGQTDDQLTDELGVWLRTLLADDVAAERQRVAQALARTTAREAAELASLHDERVAVVRRGRLGGMLAIGAVAALAALGIAGTWLSLEHALPPVTVATTGEIDVSVTPAASVYLDGRAQGQGSMVQLPEVPPGSYTLTLEAPRHTPWSTAIVVTRGGVTRVSATLEPIPEVEPVTLAFESRPLGADVLVDGKFVGRTPTRTVLETAPGSVVVTFRRTGFANEVRTVSGLRPGVRKSVSVVMAPP